MMSTGILDSIAFIEAIALAGCWIWVQSNKLSYSGWRRKSALASFVCTTVTAILYLLLTGVVHWIAEGNFRGNLYLGIFGVAILSALLSLVLGILGRGSPRIMALVWSSCMLSQAALTIAVALRVAG